MAVISVGFKEKLVKEKYVLFPLVDITIDGIIFILKFLKKSLSSFDSFFSFSFLFCSSNFLSLSSLTFFSSSFSFSAFFSSSSFSFSSSAFSFSSFGASSSLVSSFFFSSGFIS